MLWRGMFVGDQLGPHPKGRPSASNFGELTTYTHTVWRMGNDQIRHGDTSRETYF